MLWATLGVGRGKREEEEATITEGRRPKGEGTIKLRSDGRHEGREKTRSFYGKSEREVAKKIRQARREREQGLSALAPDGRRVLGELVGRPPEELRRQDHARAVRGAGTQVPDPRRRQDKAQGVDHPGSRRPLRRHGMGGVGERTARYVHQVISSALERAARKHLIPFNVARYADPPPMPETRSNSLSPSRSSPASSRHPQGPASRTTSSSPRCAGPGRRRSSA